VSVLHAIVLGLVQGLSEFLPISSSGHLAIVPWLLGWDDFGDNETLAKAFDVALHLGTLVGAIAYFWRDLIVYARESIGGLLRRGEPMSNDGRIGWLLLLSAVPAAVTGALLSDVIKELDDVIWLMAVTLIVFGLVLYWADRLPGSRKADDYHVRDALWMGSGQALALQPGVSRSGITISVARRLGFERDAAARLSFLMSLPVIAGAGLYSLVDVLGEGGIPADFRAAFFWGMASSAVSGWFAVWFTIRFVRTHTFTPFVIYRVVLGVVILAVLATDAR
jgi:undecaprenyl-diphosphatase